MISYIEEPENNGNTDLQPVREFPLKNGNTVKATKDPEFGFWSLSLVKGQMPKEFQGKYTSIEEVQKALVRYSSYRDIPLGQQDPRPEVKYKFDPKHAS